MIVQNCFCSLYKDKEKSSEQKRFGRPVMFRKNLRCCVPIILVQFSSYIFWSTMLLISYCAFFWQIYFLCMCMYVSVNIIYKSPSVLSAHIFLYATHEVKFPVGFAYTLLCMHLNILGMTTWQPPTGIFLKNAVIKCKDIFQFMYRFSASLANKMLQKPQGN